jgi:hypothetical protein
MLVSSHMPTERAMAKSKKSVEEPDAVATGGEAHTIVKRLIEDEQLRDAAGRAVESGRRVHERLRKARKPSKLIDDAALHADAAAAYEAIQTVAAGIAGAAAQARTQRTKRRGGVGRMILVALVGTVAALVASEGLRSKLLDAMFGAEEEFEYSPPAAAPTTDVPLSAV